MYMSRGGCLCVGTAVFVKAMLYMSWDGCIVLCICVGTVVLYVKERLYNVQYMYWDGCICVGMVIYLNGLYAVMYTQ